MVYSSQLRRAVGAVRTSLDSIGIRSQGKCFSEHGEHAPKRDAPLVLVACSGGRDSLALAAVSRKVCASLGVRCGAVVVDHRLQSESSLAARTAAAQCVSMGLSPVVLAEVSVCCGSSGEEAAARTARYDALTDSAHWFGAAAVLVAHTLDDQAETILMDLMRSSSVSVLMGMPQTAVVDGVRLLRPFLGLTRAQTTSICTDLGISWWDDPTNGDRTEAQETLPTDFPLRSRIRHTLMPILEEFAGGGFARHLAQSAPLARRDEEYLEAQVNEVYRRVVSEVQDGSISIDVNPIAREHPAIRSRVLARALEELGITFSSSQVLAIERLVTDWHGQGGVALPSKYSANRKGHVIRVCKDGVHENR